jgi:gliding motility-associated lipoprotein GldH
MKLNSKQLILGLLVLFGSQACTKREGIKEIRDFKDYAWPIAKAEVFEIDIKDISRPYTFRYLIRNATQYPYYNLYLSQKLLDPSGATIKNTTDEIILFDTKTGKPMGDGLGDMFDHVKTVPSLKKVMFTVPGKYKWIIKHNMRPDPLMGVLSLGAEVTISE